MSHSPERKEKDCLNCGTIVQGRYCQNCGQENVVPKESFWNLVVHFFYDITHFDSKFFDTMKYLLFRPGFLSKEYLKGRRASYLNPIKMYVFTSAVFFLILFAFKDPTQAIKWNKAQALSPAERQVQISKINKKLEKDSSLNMLREQLMILSDTTKEVKWTDLAKTDGDSTPISFTDIKYKTIEAYDSAQSALPAAKKDAWFKKQLVKKQIEINKKYNNDPSETLQKMVEIFLHKLPYLLFVSLPFFALILKLIYIRRRQFYYADHIIFTIHHYIFSFLLLLFVFGFDGLQNATGYGIFGTIMGFLLFAWVIYLYVAMKRFYQQGWFKTFIKLIILNFMGSFLLVILFIFFLFFSIFQL